MENIKSFLLNESIEPGLEAFAVDFFEDRKKDFVDLKEYISSKDFVSARKITHNWKGYCKPYGFETLGILAKNIEDAIAAEDLEGVERLVQTVDYYMNEKGLLLAKG